MDFVLNDGTNLDAFVDDNSLTVTAQSVPAAPQWALVATGAGLLVAVHRRLRI